MSEQNLPREVQLEYDRIARSLAIKDEHSLQAILSTISELDKIRWEYPVNYSSVNSTLVNYAYPDLTADEKLLSHWLCYIADRQMSYRRIWEVGGYVFSHLARAYSRQPESDVSSIVSRYLRTRNQQGGSLYFECDRVTGDPLARRRLDALDASGDATVRFASRFPPDDAVRIFRTLALLDKTSGRSLSRYIAKALTNRPSAAADYRYAIRRAAASLEILTYRTYRGSPRASAANLAALWHRTLIDVEKVADRYSASPDRLMGEWLQEFHPFGRKRLWCSLRDYLKSPELNQIFVEALDDVGYPNPTLWQRGNSCLKEALDAVELPGDVRNNNPVFRKGLFDPYVETKTRLELTKVARGIYQHFTESGIRAFYPEQLDVTFDFAPRMCHKEKCDRCVFGAGIRSLCSEQEGAECPATRALCDYYHKCEPSTCALVADSARGLCGVWRRQVVGS